MLKTLRKGLNLFDTRERWKLAGLFLAVVIMGFAQMAGVASIMPFLSLVSDPSVVHTNERLNWAYRSLGFSSETTFLFAVGLGVLCMIALSNAIVAVTTWLILRFTWASHSALSVRLLEKYLREPYTFYLGQNSAKLSKNILTEVTSVVQGVLVPALKMFAKLVIAIFIMGLLLYTDPTLALIAAGVLGGMYGVIYFAVRRKQLRLGRERLAAGSARYKSVTEALTGIKDVKVLGCEPVFVGRFASAARKYARAQASNAVTTEIPKFALDTVAFGGILLIVLYVIGTRGELAEVVPVVGLYAFAAYRLMPALQTIFNSLGKIRFNGPALDVLYEHLARDEKTRVRLSPHPQRISLDDAIEFEDLSYRYPGSDSWVLDNVSLRIPKNDIIGFVGTTGSGKTTSVDIILGLLEPQEGCLKVDGVPLGRDNIPAWQRSVGYVSQQIFLTDDTVTRNIAFGVPDAEIDHEAVVRAAGIANLHEFISGLPDGYGTLVGDRGLRLSGGQRQRIGIARALYRDPDVLVLDEATSALDGVTEDAIMSAIHSLAGKKTIVLIAHRLSTVQRCDTIYLFERGGIAAKGSYSELMSISPEFRAMARVGREAVSAA